MTKLTKECLCCANADTELKKPTNQCEIDIINEERIDDEEKEENRAFILSSETNEQATNQVKYPSDLKN